MRLFAADLLADGARSAAALHRAGVRAGDTVALRGVQTRAYVAALVGLWRLGAVAVPLAPRLPDGDGLARRLATVGARWLVTDAPDKPPGGVARLPVPDLTDAPLALPPWPNVDGTGIDGTGIDGGAPALCVFTSGSTGAAKAAQLSMRALRASARGVNAALGVDAAAAWLLALPLVHVGGIGVLVRMLEAGGSVVLPAPGTPLDAALTDHPTHVSLVATQLHRLLRDGHAPLLSGTTVLLGGSAIAPALLDAATRAGVRLATSYGLTEMASTVTTTDAGAPRDALTTSGRVLAGRTLDVLNADADGVGEIVVGGATRFDGYRTERGLTRPFDADGRFATGDLGRLDADGRLVVHGRRDRMFVSGGENVHPEAVERALVALDGVSEAVVVAVPDAEFGARAVAFVATDGPLDAARLLAEAAERLPGPMRPVAIAPLPTFDGLKPSRAALTALAEAQHPRR